MKLWMIGAFVVAVALVAVWLGRADVDPAVLPHALTAEEAGQLPADLDGDFRLIEHLRARAGFAADGWRRLPEEARTLYATLYIEEASRLNLWPEMAAHDLEPAVPFEDAAAAYRVLGAPQAADAAEQLQRRFTHDRQLTPQAGERSGSIELERAAALLATTAAKVRPLRLAYLRTHLTEVQIK